MDSLTNLLKCKKEIESKKINKCCKSIQYALAFAIIALLIVILYKISWYNAPITAFTPQNEAAPEQRPEGPESTYETTTMESLEPAWPKFKRPKLASKPFDQHF